jgi:hypothetical protein
MSPNRVISIGKMLAVLRNNDFKLFICRLFLTNSDFMPSALLPISIQEG